VLALLSYSFISCLVDISYLFFKKNKIFDFLQDQTTLTSFFVLELVVGSVQEMADAMLCCVKNKSSSCFRLLDTRVFTLKSPANIFFYRNGNNWF
jgi:hypothetical protein